jgi:hypothetical protein
VTQRTAAENVTPDRRPLLEALGTVLRAHKLHAEMTDNGLYITTPDADEPNTTVVARERSDDGDRMWFLTFEGDPLAECDNYPDVVTAIKGLVNTGQEIRRVVRPS